MLFLFAIGWVGTLLLTILVVAPNANPNVYEVRTAQFTKVAGYLVIVATLFVMAWAFMVAPGSRNRLLEAVLSIPVWAGAVFPIIVGVVWLAWIILWPARVVWSWYVTRRAAGAERRRLAKEAADLRRAVAAAERAQERERAKLEAQRRREKKAAEQAERERAEEEQKQQELDQKNQAEKEVLDAVRDEAVFKLRQQFERVRERMPDRCDLSWFQSECRRPFDSLRSEKRIRRRAEQCSKLIDDLATGETGVGGANGPLAKVKAKFDRMRADIEERETDPDMREAYLAMISRAEHEAIKEALDP